MSIRETIEYQEMSPVKATMLVEDGSEDEQELQAAWQYLHDSGLAYQLQGWYGRNATAMINQGFIER